MPRMSPKQSCLMIRLALHGCTNRPFYHLVVMAGRAHRNAFPLEQLGTYDPMPNLNQEKLVAINFERLKHWMASGAHCSKPVEKLLGLSGFYPVHPMSYLTAKRNRAKQAQSQAEEAAEATQTEQAQNYPVTHRQNSDPETQKQTWNYYPVTADKLTKLAKQTAVDL